MARTLEMHDAFFVCISSFVHPSNALFGTSKLFGLKVMKKAYKMSCPISHIASERVTKDEMRAFEALFKCVSTRFELLTIERSIINFVWGA